MLSTQINLRTLKAVALAAGEEKTRACLHGVLVECRSNSVTYVATDGRILFAAREALGTLAEGEARLEGDFVIPSAVCAAHKLTKNVRAHLDAAFLARDGESDLRVTQTLGACAVHVFAPVGGTFPDWRRYLPSVLSGSLKGFKEGEEVFFDTLLLEKVRKFGEILAAGAPVFGFNGAEAAAATFPSRTGAFVVAMPLRTRTQAEALKLWGEQRKAFCLSELPKAAPTEEPDNDATL